MGGDELPTVREEAPEMPTLSLMDAISGPSLPSIGSRNHAANKCKPCAFVHRPVGCADGANCSWCHLCPPGEKKRRQKQKFEALQRRRLTKGAAKAATAAARYVEALPQK